MMLDTITNTISLGSLLEGTLVLIVTIVFGVPAYRVARRQNETHHQAEESRKRAAEAAQTAEQVRAIVTEVLHQVNPSNGRTVAQTAESTNSKMDQLQQQLEAHLRYSDETIDTLRAAGIDVPKERNRE